MGTMLVRTKQILLGENPRALLWLMAPTFLSIAIDVILRGGDFIVWEPHGEAIYFSSLLISSAFWVFTLLVGARLINALVGSKKTIALVGLILLFEVWVFPIAAFSYGGEILYFKTFAAYAGRDTLRLGALFRGGYWAWFFAWSNVRGLFVMIVVGECVTLGALRIVRRAAPELAGTFPILPVVTFLGAIFCFWTDQVDSRFLQAATPDTCFMNGATHALKAAITGEGRIRQGVTLRNPTPLPKLTSTRAHPPNIILIITESVRADTLCSEPPPRCHARFLDAADVAADRISLGKLTSQTPNTFSASITLWTGLAPNTDFADAHRAPVLWEIAHALGYRTAYITSQNAKYEDFGIFVHNAGIDVRQTSTELRGMAHEQIGAPDERATSEMLRFIHEVPQNTPYFAVLHLSNTHHPYRIDPDLQPFTPSSDDPSGDIGAYFNRYRNSVLMQERLVASFLRDVRKTPSWNDTAILFVSDHAEQFGEHGGTHHNHSVFDSDLRIPGFVIAGSDALREDERAALRSYATTRTYSQDVNETIVDLLGVGDQRASLPESAFVHGRSLLRARDRSPIALLATSTGVWEPNDAWFGVMQDERALIAYEKGEWACYDMTRDPGEKRPKPASACPDLLEAAKREFPPGVGRYPK
jgi:glucan phosphoethanolaminetransferase (alkaline phosphatase superfamily)